MTEKILGERSEKMAYLIGAESWKVVDAYKACFGAHDIAADVAMKRAHQHAQRNDFKLRLNHYRVMKTSATNLAFQVDIKKLMETYIAIAFVDPNELIQQRIGACRYCHSHDHRYHWKEHEYMEAVAKYEAAMRGWQDRGGGGARPEMPDPHGGLDYKATVDPNPECPVCEGEGIQRVVFQDTTKLSPAARMLYRGVKITKDGVAINFANQDKALEQIGRMIGAFDDKVRLTLTDESMKVISDDPREAASAYAKMIDAK